MYRPTDIDLHTSIEATTASVDREAPAAPKKRGPKPKPIIEFPDAIHGPWIDPPTFADALDYDTALRDAIRRLELQLGEHWRSIARMQFQPLLSLGELLSRMNVENDLGDRMVAFGRKALNPGTQPSAAQLLDSVATLRGEYEVLQAERAAAIGSDDVGEFINALAESRATLKMVTPTVQAWLSEHDALDALEISPR